MRSGIHCAPVKEECAMSNRLMFSLAIVSMGILMLWAFTSLTDYETPPSATKTDRLDSVPR